MEIEAIPGVCEVERFAASTGAAAGPCDLLVEVPHGATLERHYDALARRLRSPLPADLREFFFVNTDVGAPECALAVARLWVDPAANVELARRAGVTVPGRPRRALVLRSLLPRTLCDCNRVVQPQGAQQLTPAIPEYVTAPEDRALLQELHARYDETARRAYAQVCGAGGTAIALHSYAPRSVAIDTLDARIVERLREAYRPGTYETWPRRPTVDIISESDEGDYLAPPELVREIRSEFAKDGVTAVENATYRLHGGTAGLLHSRRHRGRVLCIEFDRAALAEPFTPFREMRIGQAKLRAMTLPLAAALLRVAAAAPG
jgi:hypothetical protein